MKANKYLFSAWLLAMLSACAAGTPPAPASATTEAAKHDDLNKAINAPLNRAKSVEAEQQEAADRQRAEIDAATQ